MELKHDRPFVERQTGKCLSVLWKLISEKAKEDSRPPLCSRNIITDFRRKALFLRVGRRLLELFVLGDIDNEGHCHIIQNLDDTTHAPEWLTQDAINEMVATANSSLSGE